MITKLSSEESKRRFEEVLKKWPLYRIWVNMRYRTRNPNAANYYRYGGRGITVCDEWDNSYQAFEDYMGPRPGPEYSVDRIDPDGNYEPGNVRWATATEQQNNRKDTVYLEYKGDIKSISDWARETNINYGTLVQRRKRGWSDEKTLTEPVATKLKEEGF